LNASHFTPIDEDLIPTGEIASVSGTPLDFRRPTIISERIDAVHEQMRRAGGYDHNFVLDKRPGEELSFAARLYHPATGRTIEVYTTEPGVQLYSGNSIDGRYGRRSGLTLETQHFPDSPNRPQFPDTILRPGDEFRSRTVYRFLVDDAGD
jgi:aldose 1-epimerase